MFMTFLTSSCIIHPPKEMTRATLEEECGKDYVHLKNMQS